MVTGGTGSFGKKFTEIVLSRYKPRRLIIFSRDELKQFEMRERFGEDRYNAFVISSETCVIETGCIAPSRGGYCRACCRSETGASGEYNPSEAVKTNVLGAMNVIDAAIDCNVKQVIALSTDKAANPINLYGATKLCSDKLFVAANSYSGHHDTRFSIVRMGMWSEAGAAYSFLFEACGAPGCCR